MIEGGEANEGNDGFLLISLFVFAFVIKTVQV